MHSVKFSNDVLDSMASSPVCVKPRQLQRIVPSLGFCEGMNDYRKGGISLSVGAILVTYIVRKSARSVSTSKGFCSVASTPISSASGR